MSFFRLQTTERSKNFVLYLKKGSSGGLFFFLWLIWPINNVQGAAQILGFQFNVLIIIYAWVTTTQNKIWDIFSTLESFLTSPCKSIPDLYSKPLSDFYRRALWFCLFLESTQMERDCVSGLLQRFLRSIHIAVCSNSVFLCIAQ